MSDEFDIEQTLSPIRRAMAVRRLVRWTVAGTGVGAAVAAASLAGLRLHGSGPITAVVVCLLFPAAAIVLSLVLRPTLADAARRADVHFDLQDRLTTALEYRSSNEPLIALQRAQTARATRDKPLASAAGAWLVRRELIGAVLAVLIALGLFVAPSPTASHASPAGAAEVARIRHLASTEIPALQKTLPRNNATATRRARQVLAHLQAQLRRATTRAQALRALSVAQEKLAQIRAAVKPVDPASSAALARALRSYVPEYRGPAQMRAARALSTIARNLNHASSAQKGRMARDLQKAANATHDTKTRSLLRKAASAIGYGDKRRAQKALQRASRRLRNSNSQQKVRKGLDRTSQRLGSTKYNFTSGRLGKLQGEPFQSGRKSKYSHEPANGQAASGNSSSRRDSLSKLAAGLNGKRNMGESGQASDSGGYSRGKQADVAGHGQPRRFGEVYLKGKLTRGTYNVQVGPTGQVQRLNASGYKHVIADYASTAEDALNRTSLPPSLRTYVRRYFVVLSHP